MVILQRNTPVTTLHVLYGPLGVRGARVASRAGQARSLEHAPVPGHTLVPETQLKRGLAKTVFVVLWTVDGLIGVIGAPAVLPVDMDKRVDFEVVPILPLNMEVLTAPETTLNS